MKTQLNETDFKRGMCGFFIMGIAIKLCGFYAGAFVAVFGCF